MATFRSHSIGIPSDLFALAVHPTRPLFTVGLSSGHVYTYTTTISSAATEDSDEEVDQEGDEDKGPNVTEKLTFKTSWKTKRHKGSCRNAIYSNDGQVLYTAGTDSLLKAATTETGKVTTKTLLPSETDAASSLLALSPQHLLVGTDNGSVHLYDLRTPTDFNTPPRPSISWPNVHEDYIASLTALPATAASTTGFSRQFIATGDTTLTHLDIRKASNGALARSEPQEDEMLCGAVVTRAPSKKTGGSTQLITGTAGGVVTGWNPGFWEDHQTRVSISRSTGDSVDSLTVMPDDWELASAAAGYRRYYAAGSGDGKVRVVEIGANRTVTTLSHSYSTDQAKRMGVGRITKGDHEIGLEEGVAALGIDCEGRIISGGGMVVKVWTLAEPTQDQPNSKKKKRSRQGHDNSSGDGESEKENDSDDSDDSDGEKESKKRKRRKRKGGKGKAKSAGVKNFNTFSGLD